MTTVVGAVLAGLGVLVVVAAALGALLPRTARGRLHFVTPVTSVGTPLVGAGLAVATGWQFATATIVCTVLLMAVTGPAVSAAIGRVSAQRDGRVDAGSPQ